MRRYAATMLPVWIAVLFMAFWSSESKADKGAPIIKIPEPSYDWGEVPKGEVVAHAYDVLNKGSAELEITHIQSD
jgi:hypothetical protein